MVENIEAALCGFDISNITFIYQNGPEIEINSTSPKVSCSPRRFKHLSMNRKQLKSESFDAEAHYLELEHENGYLSKINEPLLSLLAEKLEFTPSAIQNVSDHKYNNGSFSFAFETHHYSETRSLHSRSYAKLSFCIAVPPGRPVLVFDLILKPLQPLVWGMFWLTMIVMVLFVLLTYVLNKSDVIEKRWRPITINETLRIVYGMSFVREPNHFILKALLILLSFSAIVLGSRYQSSLASYLTTLTTNHRIRAISDVRETNLHVYLPAQLADYLSYLPVSGLE